MSGCNATLNNLACNHHFGGPESSHPAPHRHHNTSGRLVLAWGDEAPGAKPHTPPRRFVHDAADCMEGVLRRERDAFRAALEKIAKGAMACGPCRRAAGIANEALEAVR